MSSSFSQVFSNFSGASLQSGIKQLAQHPVPRFLLSFGTTICQRLGIPGVPGLVAIVLVVLVMSKSADITWDLLEPTDTGATLNNSGLGVSQKIIPTMNLTSQIVSLHLFGKAEEKKKKVARKTATNKLKQPKAVPVTPLNLTLFGVFVQSNPEDSTAIIGKSKENQHFYHIGDAVSSGAKLVEVYDDSVTLLRNERNEVLRFPEKGSTLSLINKFLKPKFSRKTPALKKGASLSQYRKMIKSSPQEIFKHIGFAPVVKGKVRSGFRIFPKKDHQLFKKLGIRSSDIVTGVNGISLNNSLQATALMKELTQPGALELQIIRNGIKKTITVGD